MTIAVLKTLGQCQRCSSEEIPREHHLTAKRHKFWTSLFSSYGTVEQREQKGKYIIFRLSLMPQVFQASRMNLQLCISKCCRTVWL